MQPFYWESAHGNFGDDLNLWLWDFLLPGFREVHPEILLVGVGTVLNQVLLPGGVKKLVVGSGFGYGAAPALSDPGEWDVRSILKLCPIPEEDALMIFARLLERSVIELR